MVPVLPFIPSNSRTPVVSSSILTGQVDNTLMLKTRISSLMIAHLFHLKPKLKWYVSNAYIFLFNLMFDTFFYHITHTMYRAIYFLSELPYDTLYA